MSPPPSPQGTQPHGVPEGRVKRAAAFAFGLSGVFPSVFPPALRQPVLLLKLEGAAWTAPRCLCI